MEVTTTVRRDGPWLVRGLTVPIDHEDRPFDERTCARSRRSP